MTPCPLIKIRLMTKRDEPHWMAIQTDAYGRRFLETPEVFFNRLTVFPKGCWVAEHDYIVLAYLISHPWQIHSVPKLNDPDLQIPPNPNCYYIHSLTLLSKWQRRGIGRQMCEHVLQIAGKLGFTKITLTSVQGSHVFWSKCGFREMGEVTEVMKRKLASYGSGARFMIRETA
jgi:GNAT superfamily N-acetyltransferase